MLPLIVEPQDLEPLLGSKQLLIIDLCKESTYQDTHIPGAIHVFPQELIAGIQPAVGKLASKADLEALFSRIGLTADHHVVAYDDEGGGWAGRFLWTLEVIGHKNYSYLNGGLVAWSQENRLLESEPGSTVPTQFKVRLQTNEIAEMDDVMAAIDSKDSILWDARSAEEYAGIRVLTARGGHIPGAISLDWLLTMDPGAGLRIRADIVEFLAAQGISGEKPIITYCQTHHRSGLTWLIGRSLNYPIRAYHGGWSEWGNDPQTSIET
jgi:thiosulfate/3-mercaptopyruvate sulfurtransferase